MLKTLFRPVYVPGSSPKNEKQEKNFKFPTLKEIFQYPISEVEIFPTRQCAENCVGCSVPTQIRWGQETRMPVEWWIDFIKNMARRGVNYIMIMGGEPTTYPGIEKIIKILAELKQEKKINGGIFTDGIPLCRNPQRLEFLIANGLLEITTHSSVDFLVEKEPLLEEGKKVITSRHHKAFYGLEILQILKKKGARGVVANTVVMPDNLDQIIPLYRKCEAEGIIMTIVPFQWQCHLYQGREKSSFTNYLTDKHILKLKKIVNFILKNEKDKIEKGEERTVLNSSRFLRAIPTLGVAQPVNCNNFAGPPGVFAVLPDGTFRHCPVVTKLEDVWRCPGCHYGFRDRNPKFENYLEAMGIFDDPEGKDFPNIVHQI